MVVQLNWCKQTKKTGSHPPQTAYIRMQSGKQRYRHPPAGAVASVAGLSLQHADSTGIINHKVHRKKCTTRTGTSSHKKGNLGRPGHIGRVRSASVVDKYGPMVETIQMSNMSDRC
ncbi:hypothetical protein M514_05558, partial [Trichuris suis]